jgi:transcription initiation factor TFIIH subunit 3
MVAVAAMTAAVDGFGENLAKTEKYENQKFLKAPPRIRNGTHRNAHNEKKIIIIIKTMSEARSLLTIVLDVSPVPWGERDLRRSANDKTRLAQGKRSVGPAILEEALVATRSFVGTFSSLEKDSVVVIVAVAASECAVVYPRKNQLHEFFQNANAKLDIRTLHESLVLGVSELVERAAKKDQAAAETSSETTTSSTVASSHAAMAAGLSIALCTINRFLVAANQGVSALLAASSITQTAAWKRRQDDQGVLSLMSNDSSSNNQHQKSSSSNLAWSPRILMIQASEDRSHDYNSLMNGVFAATKHNIIIDGCFIPSGISTNHSKSSPFLEQACDYTGGVFLAPSGAAQIGGALNEVLTSVFLAPRHARHKLNLPALNKVDFRARAFDTGESVDMAWVCNQCLSIFKVKPAEYCPTCGADIKST